MNYSVRVGWMGRKTVFKIITISKQLKTSMTMKETTFPKFSFFNGPITNTRPNSSGTIADVYRGLTSNYYKEKTAQLRNTIDPAERRKAKKNLDYVTFSGTFRQSRAKENLIQHSGYICIDLDHIEPPQIEVIKATLLKDKMLETQLLFISPSGNGLKWVVEVDLNICPDHETNYNGISYYLKNTYPDLLTIDIKTIDQNCKDVSRACFLCHDPEAYINPKYQKNGSIKI